MNTMVAKNTGWFSMEWHPHRGGLQIFINVCSLGQPMQGQHFIGKGVIFNGMIHAIHWSAALMCLHVV